MNMYTDSIQYTKKKEKTKRVIQGVKSFKCGTSNSCNKTNHCRWHMDKIFVFMVFCLFDYPLEKTYK